MKKLIIPSAIAIALLFSSCGNSGNEQKGNSGSAMDTTKLKTGDIYYQCEMHPEVISDKPGKCSKCEMDLMKVNKK